MLPAALPPVVVQISVTIGFAILLTAGLSFVGAGIAPPTPELGGMISTGATYLVSGQWWPALFPGIALGVVVFVFAAVGEIFGKVLEPAGSGFHHSETPLGVGLTVEGIDPAVADQFGEGARR
jgi:peptide/nickel transport system permease protein